MHVKDIMSGEVVVIDKDQNIHDALKLMKKHKISRLPVVNGHGRNNKELVGIITEKDIALRLGSSKYGNLPPSHFHVSTVMTPEPITIESNKNLGNAAQLIVKNKIGGIPVVDDGELVGIITKTDFVKTCQGVPYNKTLIKERMTTDLMTISPQERLVHARRMIIDEDVGRLLVMDENRLEGIITAKDIAHTMISFRKVVPDKYQPARIRNLIIEDIMPQNVRTIEENVTIADASMLMIDEEFSGIPVTGENSKITGIITKTDIMKFIVELEEVH
ncbi:MAG: CBS domain-containing protein [Methanobacterium sp.]|uniref:CBS domain-containing protein n=1 Tax=Methanobacterium sp. TaxID=2164 RepID=UPI003D6557CF|nr:CBS domain-containing protein [Methanobacterium sp.]